MSPVTLGMTAIMLQRVGAHTIVDRKYAAFYRSATAHTFCRARGLPPILAAYIAANCPSVNAQPSPADLTGPAEMLVPDTNADDLGMLLRNVNVTSSVQQLTQRQHFQSRA